MPGYCEHLLPAVLEPPPPERAEVREWCGDDLDLIRWGRRVLSDAREFSHRGGELHRGSRTNRASS